MFEKKESYNIAIIGATGIVGESLLDILHTRKFPVKKIDPIASSKSAGNKVRFGDELLEVLDIELNFGHFFHHFRAYVYFFQWSLLALHFEICM